MSEQIITQAHLTIVDNNDIESIVVEYARNQSTTDAPTSGWSTNRPAWAQGYYIWQRTRIHKSGTQASADTFGTAVCLTGSTGQTGSQGPQGETGATGQSLSSTKTQYTNVASNVTITTSNHTSYTWTDNVPAYDSSKPVYWCRITNTYTNPAKTEYIVYKDQGTTDAIKTSNDANSTAAAANATANNANQTANDAKNKVDSLETTYNTFINTKAKYFVHNSNGSIVIASREGESSPVTFDEDTVSTYGYNALTAPSYIALRYNSTELAKLSTGALTFYKPNTTNKGMELTSTALTFYNPSTNTAQLIIGANGTLQSGNYSRGSDSKFSSNGTKIDLVNGDIITKYFRVSQGLESGLTAGVYVHGTIEALDGTIGTDSTNYWEIGNGIDYNLNSTAKMVGHGSSYIQLGDSSTWRLATNRIHTGWYTSGDSLLHFPAIDSKYWDFGIHAPTAATEKLLYIRKSKANTSASNVLTNLLYDIDDSYATPQWDYMFYISANGSLYAKNLYVLDDNGNPIQIGGTDGVYLLKSGGTITGNLEVNGTLTKGGKTVTYLTSTPTSGQILVADGTSGSIKTSGYTIATSVPSGALFTDKNVQTSQANTTKIYLAGTSTAGTTTGTLNYDSNIYADTTAGALHATTFNGYTLAAASAKGVDTSLTAASTSTNLPTSKAVADLIKQYLPLTGGSVTGPVSFGDSVSIDDLTVGNLIVNGAGRFTNGLYGDLIGNADTATKVGKSLKIQLNGGTTEGTNQFTFDGSAAKTVNITKSSIGLGNVENKSSATIRGELTSTNITTALGFTPYNSTNPNGYTTNTGTVTSVAASGSGGITISDSPITTSGTITVGLNLSTAINGLGEGASNATRNDYIVAQYAGGGTTTTTYHRRKLSNIFAALNSSDITTALGYTPYDATNPNGYTTNTGTVTSVKVQGSNGLTGSGTVTTTGTITLSHADTSSQASSSNSGRTYIQSVTLDDYGHVTGLSTATETVTDTHHTANLITGASATAKANAAATNGNVYLNLVENNTVRNAHKIVGSGTTTVTSDADGVITISSADSKTGTVTSITLTQGTGISIGSSGTAITTSGTRTIALADNYGDTKNPYASKTARYVLAAPTNAAGAPSFRALTGADVGLDSVLNATQVTGIGQGADGKIRVYKGDSNYEDVPVEIVATESSSVASAQKLTSYGGSTNQPVYFPNSGTDAGKPVAIGYTIETSVPSGAVFTDTTYTFASGTNGFTVTPLNGTAQTVTVTPSIANNITGSGTSGYLAKFNGANTITNGPALGTDATKFLNNKGEWVVPGGTYSLPLAANGTRGGVQIGYTQSGKNYPVQLSSEKMYVNVPWENTTYSAGTGLSLSGTTFSNSGVTGVKGGAENSYRTGQVNLTAANIGAVALSGNETIAGNKTFSGTTTLSTTSTYSTQSGTVIPANSTAIIQSPIPKYLWHDIWGFCKATTPKYYTSTNGSTWTEATLEKNLFAHKEAWGESNVLSSSIQGSRWTWLNGGFYASNASWLVLGITYKNPSAHFNLLLETSSDGGSTWTTLINVTDLYYSQTPIWVRNSTLCQNSLQLTITWNSNSASNAVLGLCSIKFLTSRWGDQGKGSEFEYPYNWDGIPNIYPLQDNISDLGTPTYKWANVYATTFNGSLSGNATSATNAISATKATQDGDGNTISSTYLKLSGGTVTGITKFNTIIRDANGQHYYGGAANRSRWYKITLAHNGVTPPTSNAQWYMCSMTLHIAGDFSYGPRGTIELCYYIYWDKTKFIADKVFASGYGVNLNNVKIYYDLTNPFEIYADVANAYTSLWVDYVSYRDSAQGHNSKETKVETTDAITVADYLQVPISCIYTYEGSSLYITSNHFSPSVANSKDLGTSTYKWKNIYATTVHATTFNGSLSGNATSATKSGTSAILLYPEHDNEINFGGTNTSSTIFFGYRATDSRTIPTKFVFGGSTGTADLQAKTLYLGSGTTSYISSTDYTGKAATAGIADSATKATQDGDGNTIASTYLKISGGTMTGPLQWTSASLPEFSGSPSYLVGIEAFASGGAMKWKATSSITVGNATTAANLTAGTATNDYKPIWFTANNTNQRAVNDYLTFRNDTKDLKVASLSMSTIDNVTARANVKYDSTLEAIVFSFA